MTTPLRQKMIEAMQLRGLAARNQEAYLRSMRQLAAYFNKSPDQVNEEELRQYLLYLKKVKKASRSTITLALCGIKFFFQYTLGLAACPPEFLAARQSSVKDLPRQVPASLAKDAPLRADTAQSLAARVGGALQSSWKWAHRFEIPGPLCLSRGD